MSFTQTFNNLSVGKKLTGGFALLVFLTLIIAVISIQTFSQYNERSLIVAAVSSAETSLLDARTDEKNFRLRRESQYIESAKRLANSAATHVAPLKELLVVPPDNERIDTIIASVQEYQALLDRFEANITAAPRCLVRLKTQCRRLRAGQLTPRERCRKFSCSG